MVHLSREYALSSVFFLLTWKAKGATDNPINTLKMRIGRSIRETELMMYFTLRHGNRQTDNKRHKHS